MKLIVGLGNPGLEHDRSRHNVGWEVLDRVARRHADPSAGVARAKFHGLLLEANIGPERVLLLKPTTFMNLSGQSVVEAVQFYRLDPANDLLVVADDLALPCGAIRLRGEGGPGGHNGLADITQRLASESWARLRVGIDAPGQIPQAAYVLGRFRPDQQPLVESAIEDAVQAVADWVTSGITSTMNKFNRKIDNPQPTANQ